MYRRSFITRVTGLAAFVGIGQGGGSAVESSPVGRWQPMRHPQDDWFDEIPGKHRIFFDASTAAHVDDAVMFARNYQSANQSAYGLEPHDLAVVVGLRHRATPFAFNDTIWSKYGKVFAERVEIKDPKTGQPPTTNLYHGLTTLVRAGVQLAVCDMATHALSRRIADANDGDPAAIYKELVANTLGNAHFVAAGIVAVDRAQERGYSIVHIG